MVDDLKQLFQYIESLPVRVLKSKNETEKEYKKRKELTLTQSKYWDTNWNQDTYFKFISQEHKPVYGKIIAVFSQEKDYQFDNYKQIAPFFDRNIKIARRLEGYNLDKIRRVCKYLNKKADYKWTIETVEKFILENIDEFEGEKPIIILKNGEKIYDISRLQELEKQKRIHWIDNKWIES